MVSSEDDATTTTWYAVLSEKHQQEYYFNPVTGESTWELPANHNGLMCNSWEESVSSMDQDNAGKSKMLGDESPEEQPKKRAAVATITVFLLALALMLFGSLSKDKVIQKPNNDITTVETSRSQQYLESEYELASIATEPDEKPSVGLESESVQGDPPSSTTEEEDTDGDSSIETFASEVSTPSEQNLEMENMIERNMIETNGSVQTHGEQPGDNGSTGSCVEGDGSCSKSEDANSQLITSDESTLALSKQEKLSSNYQSTTSDENQVENAAKDPDHLTDDAPSTAEGTTGTEKTPFSIDANIAVPATSTKLNLNAFSNAASIPGLPARTDTNSLSHEELLKKLESYLVDDVGLRIERQEGSMKLVEEDPTTSAPIVADHERMKQFVETVCDLPYLQ